MQFLRVPLLKHSRIHFNFIMTSIITCFIIINAAIKLPIIALRQVLQPRGRHCPLLLRSFQDQLLTGVATRETALGLGHRRAVGEELVIPQILGDCIPKRATPTRIKRAGRACNLETFISILVLMQMNTLMLTVAHIVVLLAAEYIGATGAIYSHMRHY